ncbi:GTP-binding protein [Marinicauda pacifica]|jgi:flagellar biosynthesis protein FlhF|uniref:Flagellar biosynthesis-like protein (FlhF) n=1 Tax=Marinicauda pacifica TaxID=1133559 RepID=A0A4V3RZC0_9PROT|nr:MULTISPECIES: flagellar biosynthesis-like protein (FlhF) [Marinicauda]TGY93719.1 flagellar biosynthesis-like protein (FlhF) [Marinicauda pacifica]GGE29741.1 GTP-binding protein [Marinicauda pacifica]
MRLRTFTARTLSDAMAAVRRDMGPDAVIIATSNAPDGQVEVRAAAERASVTSTNESAEAAMQRRDTERAKARGDNADGVTRIARALAWHAIPEAAAEALMDAAMTLQDGEATASLARAVDARYAVHPVENDLQRPVLFAGGPGAGKSSTLAKVCARMVAAGESPVIIGADEGAGAGEQLAAYAAALKVRFETVRGGRELALVMDELDRGPVLIDAPAINPYDLDDLHGLADLAAAADAEMIAVIEAGLAPGDAEDAAALLASVGVGRAIITKLDIARRLGGLIGVGEAGLAYAHISASPYIGTGLAPATALRIARALLDDFAIDWYEDERS